MRIFKIKFTIQYILNNVIKNNKLILMNQADSFFGIPKTPYSMQS